MFLEYGIKRKSIKLIRALQEKQSKPKKSNGNHAGHIGKPKQTSENNRISCAGNAKSKKKQCQPRKSLNLVSKNKEKHQQNLINPWKGHRKSKKSNEKPCPVY